MLWHLVHPGRSPPRAVPPSGLPSRGARGPDHYAPIGRAPCDALSPRMLRIIGELAEHWRRVDDIEGVVIHVLEHMLCINRRPAQWTEQRCLPRPNVPIGQSMPNELSHVSHAFCSSPRRRLLQHWEKTRLSIELRTYFTNRHLPKRFGSRRGSDCPAENSGNRTLLPVKHEAERRGSSNECRILETARRGVRGPNYPG